MRGYFRPLLQNDPARSEMALRLHDTDLWFDQVEVFTRSDRPAIMPVSAAPSKLLECLMTPFGAVAGLDLHVPNIMGVINTTPDSFSDGGKSNAFEDATSRARQMIEMGVAILDIGGESTRPGADPVPVDEEIERTSRVIVAIRKMDPRVTISIDTRKAPVAEAAIAAGANMVNDVSAMSYDEDMVALVAKAGVPICLMHAQGDPTTMQDDPRYVDVVLDVYDHLSERIDVALSAGIARKNILIDPGIGFGKTLEHNLSLLRRMSLFHGLGCPIILGASRKRFIGTISGEMTPAKRGPGSVAVALEGLRQGVQIIRAHDIYAHKQAIALWTGLSGYK